MEELTGKGKKKRRVLIISDGKRGHVHQTEGVARKLKGIIGKKLEIKMSKPYYLFLVAMSFMARRFKFSSPLILFWIQKVTNVSIESLVKFAPDLIISAGSFTHPVTFLLGKIWNAKTVVCMRPSLLSASDFNLVVAPRHDQEKCKGENVIYTMGAASHISEGFIFAESVALHQKIKGDLHRPVGLLIGGESAHARLDAEMAGELMNEVLLACEEYDLSLLTTTSRRTSPAAEAVVRDELKEHPRNAYLLLASESPDNPVPGIIGLCEAVIVTEDSVSMVSEIITGGKYAVVVKIGRKKKRNKFDKMLQDLTDEQYITYTSIDGINRAIGDVLNRKRQGFRPLDESKRVAQEIERRFFGGGSSMGAMR
ncbi:MAG: hypothetical protein BWY28_02112 [bacterium ADurb.Bin236]|nr:MAG: hypothetical protein BWY28_02112 [bacterium ADurb.Bin236]HPN95270.1 ELM1/GtrOC1 family putative glycosyltransferase [bacterium]